MGIKGKLYIKTSSNEGGKVDSVGSQTQGLARKDGAFVKNLDTVLASFNVHRQAYYSGTFVGNRRSK